MKPLAIALAAFAVAYAAAIVCAVQAVDWACSRKGTC